LTVEITLFNKHGKPVAYIAKDGETIYTWDGVAIAYLNEDKIYGWNGKQLGWFANGTVFDIYGLRSGFIHSKSPIVTQVEPIKSGKKFKKMRQVKHIPLVKPVLCYGFSTKNLEDLLEEGRTS
jgi:hypothetical protein